MYGVQYAGRAAYQADIVLEDYPYKTAHVHGRCYETLQQLAPQEVCEVLDRAGDTRLQQRVWRLLLFMSLPQP